MARRTGSRSFLNYCGRLLRELRDDQNLSLEKKAHILQKLSAVYKSMTELRQNSEDLTELAASIREIREEMDNEKRTGPEGMVNNG